MKRSGKIAAAWALIGALIALVAPSVAVAEIPSPAEQLAQESVLRLDELPAGYVLGDSWYCGRPREESDEEGIYEREEHLPPTPYEAFVDANKPTICIFEYRRLYRPAGSPGGPSVLTAFVLATPSAAAAEAGLDVGAELAASVLWLDPLHGGGTAPALGQEALLLHDGPAEDRQPKHLPGTVVLWRQGAIIAGVFAEGAKPASIDAAAGRYAALQQAIVEAPRPYRQSEAEDIPTFLGNPRLGLPVYWLGTEFEPWRGQRRSYFAGALPRGDLDYSLTGRRMRVVYNPELFLDSWAPAGWRKFAKTPVGRRQWTWHCTRSRTIQLAHGHAEIYGSYREGYETCPTFAPHHFIAHVFLPGVVIAIGEPRCPHCQGYLGRRFDSFAAMEAVVRGLRRWRPNGDS